MKWTGRATSDSDLEAIRLEDAGLRKDGEVVGINKDGHVIQWGSDCGFYTSGEDLDEFGIDGLFPEEAERLKRQGVAA